MRTLHCEWECGGSPGARVISARRDCSQEREVSAATAPDRATEKEWRRPVRPATEVAAEGKGAW
jgi:hypothetical protein